MATDRAVATLIALGERGHVRGPAQVLDAARTDSQRVGLEASSRSHPRTPGPRTFRVVMVVVLLSAVGVGVVLAGLVPGRRSVVQTTHSILGEAVSPYDKQLDEWLAGYDPAERQHLRDTADPNFGEITKQYEISTLEFRRTCRKLSAAIDAASAAGPTDRMTVVHEIMDPQLDRSDARDRILAAADGQQAIFGEGSMALAWRTMTDELAAGNDTPARTFVTNDCSDALGPWIDD